MKRFLTFGLMVGLAVAIGCDQSETPPALAEALSAPVTNLSDGPLVGSVAPDIVGVDLEGVEFKLSDYKGRDDLETIQQATEEKGLNWRSFFCGEDQTIPKLYNIQGYPTIVFIDADFIVRGIDHKPNDELIDQLLSEVN